MVEDCVAAYGREEGVSAAVRGRQGMHCTIDVAVSLACRLHAYQLD